MSPRLYRLVTEDEAGVYADVALPALRDALAAAARDAELRVAVERELADISAGRQSLRDRIRRALDGTP